VITRLGVLGWPAAHSRSPAMHNAALAALGMHNWRYQRLPVPPQLFADTTRALGDAGFRGANVTIPHKQAALALADEASATARAIGAANTLTFAADGTIAAENTDAPGLMAALGESPAGKRALVLGAGGSARAAVWALREAGAADIAIWNRTPERAQALASDLGARAVTAAPSADVLVNCTPVGLAGPAGASGVERSATEAAALNQLGLTFDQVAEYSNVVDLAYHPRSTPLIAAATAHGARIVDGLQILVAQGALSLELWTGRHAPREVMARAARGADSAPDAGSARD
jgi:shikimate dehydrogenase